MILALIIIVCCIIPLLVIIYNLKRSKHFIKEYAERFSIYEIDEKISREDELIKSGNFKGIMLQEMFDRREFWENVKNYKLGVEL